MRFDRDEFEPTTRRRLLSLLNLGPWCWPEDALELERARRLAGVSGPDFTPGATILVTVNPRQASLWAFRPWRRRRAEDGVRYSHGFGPEAMLAWRQTSLALPKCLPILWRSVEQARTGPLCVDYLDTWLRDDTRRFVPEPTLEGDSFGLAFLLSVASDVLDLPLPEDLAALATLDADGRVGAVSLLPEKIEALCRLTSRIRRIIVFADQWSIAFPVADRFGVTVVPVEWGSTALAEAFDPDCVAQSLVNAVADPERRSEFVRAIFELTLRGRGEVPEWRPVRAAAALARASGTSLLEDEHRELAFVEAVAARHENNEGTFPLPEERWLARYPLPVRLKVIGTLVQQAADSGVPDPVVAEAMGRRFLVRGTEAFGEHLMLQGALGRLLAVRGRPEEAMMLQEEAAMGFRDRLRAGSSSRSLAEWLRLSGVLADQAAFARAYAFRNHLIDLGALDEHDLPYVDLAWCKTRVVGIGEVDPEETLTRLARPDIPYHVRFSALRWRIRWLDETGRSEAATSILGQLENASLNENVALARSAARYAALVTLDRALAVADEAAVVVAATVIAGFQPGLIRNLCDGAKGATAAERIALYFPY